MKKINKINFTEIILLVLVWIVLIAAPVFFRKDNDFEWSDILRPAQTLIPLFIIFLINRFVLVPGLFLKKKQLLYLGSVVGLIAVFTFGSYLLLPGKRVDRELVELARKRNQMPPPLLRNGELPPGEEPLREGPVAPFANLLIFSVLLVGFDTGLMTSFRLAKSEKEQAKLEKENAESQLAFLRNQVSPHFFMNTLNNIHSLIDIDTEEAKESIIRLSKLMRHLLYDSEVEKIPVSKEIDFVSNYVDLMKLRFSEKVNINLKIPEQLPDKKIPPLLFTSYVENAFKHGISYQKDSFIDISFTCSEDNLTFKIRNSIPEKVKKVEQQGIGIKNSRKRLNLLYGDQFILKVEDKPDEYFVYLSIPI